jgi:hypothetical protein
MDVMRVEIVFVCICALWAGEARAVDRCKRDADCVFAFRDPCFCAPCGQARRRASTLKRYKQIERGWAIKVPHCRPCRRCKQPTTWLGVEAVCRKRRCEVTGGGKPRPLRSLINVGVNRVVYTLDVVFRDGGFWPVKMPRMPYHHGSRFEWHGQLSRAERKPGRRHRFEFIVTRREIHKVPGRRQWRATYHARVVRVAPAL